MLSAPSRPKASTSQLRRSGEVGEFAASDNLAVLPHPVPDFVAEGALLPQHLLRDFNEGMPTGPVGHPVASAVGTEFLRRQVTEVGERPVADNDSHPGADQGSLQEAQA